MRQNITFFIFIFFTSFWFKSALAQIEFIENKGQWHDNVQYKGDFSGGSLFLEQNGFTMLLHQGDDLKRVLEIVHGHSQNQKSEDPVILRSFAYKMKLLGAASAPVIVTEKQSPSYNNYFIGSDRSKWAGDCKLYQAITYKNIYPNIDMRYYSEGSKLKYDFIVYPGGNPSRIAMLYDGPEDLLVKNRELIIRTPVGEVRELSPYSYYSDGQKPVEVKSRFTVKNKVVTFDVKDYDPKSVLIIDPAIIFSSFTGSRTDNWGYTATPGPDGSFYAGGISFGSGYPVSPGAFQTSFGGGVTEGSLTGGYDIALFKFSPNGGARIYATYLGGGGNEQPHSMIVDNNGNLVVAGRTNSGNFPKTVGQIGPGGDYDIFITKFNASGTGLVGSLMMGGSSMDGVNIRPKYVGVQGADGTRRNYGDDARSEVILDGAGNIILASCTQSANFPVSAGVFQASFGGGRQDGVILKFSPDLSTVLFSTFFGGTGDDACFVASIDPVTSDLYIGGGTSSSNLPGNKTGVINPAYQGGITDGFVTRIAANGSAIIKTTYLGTVGVDIVYGLKFDKAGFPYVMGTSTGSWPVINAAFSHNGGKQFISKLAPDLSRFIYSTVFGTNSPAPNISPVAFLVDRCENVYVSGWGGGINVQQGYTTSTTAGLPEVDALRNIPAADGADFYFFVLERNATRQLFGSHFGQNGGLGDHVDGGTSRFDENGIIYQAICANCGGGTVFPTTGGVWGPTNGSNGFCNQACVKIEMNFSGVGSGVRSSIAGVVNQTKGCVPFRVDFRDTLNQGIKFYWNFGDGSPVLVTTVPTASHDYTVIGQYTVMLISEDSTTCNIRDTSYLVIHAGDNKVNLDFDFRKLPPCENLTFEFRNLSTAIRGNFTSTSFEWDFGDGSPRVVAGLTPPITHTFPAPGVYNVRLFIVDSLFCNAPDDTAKEVRLSPFVRARFNVDPVGCNPYSAIFYNQSDGGTDFIWEFGDGTFSTEVNPTHTYPTGTYRVRLIAKDTNTCNKIDTSAYFTITVYDNPIASFTWSPNPPRENTPTTFTNTSSPNAVRFLWNFGDGESSTEVNPVHQYNEGGAHLAELIAYNAAGCTDTFRLTVEAIIVPLLDVPNAFTPGRFGENGFISVRGFGIGKMDWRIYNRWGQLVFQTKNRKESWDGTFKGKLQPMDVYAYTLDVEFTDGQKLRKTGDITLIR